MYIFVPNPSFSSESLFWDLLLEWYIFASLDNTRSINSCGLLIPSATFAFINFLPSNLDKSIFVSAAIITAFAFFISSFVNLFFTPEEPCVSTFTLCPNCSPIFSNASAAIYVWAIPVGHDVIANISYSSFFFVCDNFAFSAISIYLRNSSGVFASIRDFLNSVSINNVDNLLNTSKCTLSFVFGAAIKNNNFAGCPSNESNSTPSFITIADNPGFETASVFPCGIAIPSPIPVDPSSSLFNTTCVYFSLSVKFPFFAIKSTNLLIASCLLFAMPFNFIASLLSKSVIFITFILSLVFLYKDL